VARWRREEPAGQAGLSGAFHRIGCRKT
jgi:hypothetical protein